MRASFALLLSAGSLALGGCAYGMGDYGPYGSYGSYGGYGYDGYGRNSGVSVGVSIGSGYGNRYGYGYGGYGGYGSYGYSPYGYSPYGYSGYGYSPYGYGGYSSPYWGWMGDYYYPGTGYYVYDRYRRPHRWTDRQRRYWSTRRERALSSTPGTTAKQQAVRENWSDFDRRSSRNERTRTRTMRTQQD